jgi:hypothetical protein
MLIYLGNPDDICKAVYQFQDIIVYAFCILLFQLQQYWLVAS